MEVLVTKEFWTGRRVLITGQTGFKGAWLAFWLAELGAEVSGLALPPATTPNLHDLLSLPKLGRFVHADINDRAALHALAKAALLRIKIAEKQCELVPRDVYDSMIDEMAGLVLTKLSGWPARVAGTDLVVRRRAEAVLCELRTEIAEAATNLADQAGEPASDDDA